MRDRVLVLTDDPAGDAAWISVLKSSQLSLTISREWPGALPLLRPGSGQIIVCGAASQGCPVSEVLAVAQIADVPVIVMGRDINAEQWLGLYKSGAYQVVSLPAHQQQIWEAVMSAIKAAWAKSTGAARRLEEQSDPTRVANRV
jgi:DNA-binding NtrC family response regulator